MRPTMSPMGARLRRLEDTRLLRGEGCYVGDLRLDRMVYVAFVRCPYGHARIRNLSLGPARSVPGVIAAFSAVDLPELGSPMPVTRPQPDMDLRTPSPLAADVVRYAGEAVAAVVAEDPIAAADGAAAVDAEYEQLPASVDLEAAMQPGAACVHADVSGNLAGRISRQFGDVGTAFETADVVVRESFRAERSAGAAIEPRGTVASPGGGAGGAVTVWASTQAPHNARRTLAHILDLPGEQVRVITPDVGGGFGPKGRLYPEDVVVTALARRLRRPVMWQATRREDMLTTYQGRGLLAEAELAASSDGTLLGLRARLFQDCGAYAPGGFTAAWNTAQHLLGPYRLPAADIEVNGIYTHKAPLTPLRGGGRELGVWIVERLLDHLSKDLNMDPLQVRLRNALRPEEFPHDTGYPTRVGGTLVYDSGDYPGHLRKARELIDYDAVRRRQPEQRRRSIYRGVGLTLFLESTGSGSETARAEVDADGGISLAVGSPSNGQSHATTLAQVCAAQLGVPIDTVRLTSGDTGVVDEGTGTFGSRMAVAAGNATARAAAELRVRILERASDALEAAPADLEISEGVVRVRGVPDRGVTLADLAREAGDGEVRLSATHAYQPEHSGAYAGGAHAAVVEVDVETGWVDVLHYVVVHDCGTLINPTVVEGQIHGGVAHGIGNALGEMVVYDGAGRLLTDSFRTYPVPRISWAPAIEVEHHESPSPFNPGGIKGAGEGGTIGALATIASAVEDALAPLRLRLNTLPLRSADLAAACAPLRSGLKIDTEG